MHLSKLLIRNFRNFENVALHFKEGVNTVIGENASGKTNVFYALRLLLDDDLSRNSIYLKETDFNRNLNDWKGHWIILSLEFHGIQDSDISLALVNHGIGIEDNGVGYYTLYFRPKQNIRQKLYDFTISKNGKEESDLQIEFEAIINEITIDSYEPVLTCKGKPLLFIDDEFYKKYVGDFSSLEFPNPEDLDVSEVGVSANNMQTDFKKDISCTFAQALRDVESELKNYWSSPLQILLRGIGDEITEEDKQKLSTQSQDINQTIGGLAPVSKTQEGVLARLKEAVGETYSPSLRLRANLPDNIDSLIRQLVLETADVDDEYYGKVGEISLGAANLIYLAMKLHSYHMKLPSDKSAYFLFIEEPEAHLHAHIQKTLFQNIDKNKAQIIYSTHSTHISSVSQISSVNILAKHGKKSLAFQPSNGLSLNEISRLERYLDATRSTLLFAKSVILVEGDAEQILIPVMVKEVLGVNLDELGISIINVGSTEFKNIARIFDKKRVQRKCAIITDEDKAFIPLPADEKTYSQAQKDAKNSQDKGAERKILLDHFCSELSRVNLVKAFYAEHTFEVDILKAGNVSIFVSILTDIYDREIDREKSKTILNGISPNDKYSEVLRLAQKVKKGWFALLLAEKIKYDFIIPTYILKALKFCIGDMKEGVKEKILKYRLEKNGLDKNTLEKDFRESNPDDIYNQFITPIIPAVEI